MDDVNHMPVLVGLDGHPGAQIAFDWACREYAGGDTRLVACCVLTPNLELFNDVTPTGMSAWRGELQRNLAGPWTDPARAAGIEIATVVVEAETVHDGLLDAARTHNARMIIVGSNGPGRVTDRLLGSNTYKLAHRSTIPVVIVPPADR